MNSLTLRVMIVAAATSLISACGSTPPTPAETVPLHSVLDSIKRGVGSYQQFTSVKQIKTGQCLKDPGSSVPLKVEPSKVTVTLQTVSKNTNAGGVGLSVPLGVVAKFDPSFGWSGTSSWTDQTDVSLNFSAPNAKGDGVVFLAKNLTDGEEQIARVVAGMQDELLLVDHDLQPCFSYSVDDKNSIVRTISFQLDKSVNGGFSINVVGLKVSDKQTSQSIATHTIKLEMKLVGSGGQGPTTLGDKPVVK